MKNKKKQRKRYTQKPRQDYRQGGRVAYQRGDEVRYEDNLRGQWNKAVDTVKAQQPIEQTPAPAQKPIEQVQATADKMFTPTTQARPRYGKKPSTVQTPPPPPQAASPTPQLSGRAAVKQS